MNASATSASAASVAQAASERVTRHHLLDRIYHALMAACVLTLMGSAFLPIVGWKFEWVSLHWMTGVALALLVLVHIVRALVWQDWRAMIPDGPGQAGEVQHPAEALSPRGRDPGAVDHRERAPDAAQWIE